MVIWLLLIVFVGDPTTGGVKSTPNVEATVLEFNSGS